MKKNNILWGLGLIALAIGIILNEFNILPIDTKIILALFLTTLSLKTLLKRNFFLTTSLWGLIVLINPGNIFPDIRFRTIFLIVALLSIGLSLIFKRKDRIAMHYYSTNSKQRRKNTEGDNVEFKAVFNQATKYVYADDLTNLELSAVFGNLNVYLDQATINENAQILIECVFSKTEIFVPKGYRINSDSVTTVFSTINEINPPSDYKTIIKLDGEVVFGMLNIIYL